MTATEKGVLHKTDATRETTPLVGGEGAANLHKVVNAVPDQEKLAIFAKADGKGETLPKAITGDRDAVVVGRGTAADVSSGRSSDTTVQTQTASELHDRPVVSVAGNDTKVKVATDVATVAQTQVTDTLTTTQTNSTDRLAAAVTGPARQGGAAEAVLEPGAKQNA